MAKELKPAEYDGLNMMIYTDLYAPGDALEYEVTITNGGNIDAILNRLDTTVINQVDSVKQYNTATQGYILKSGQSMTFNLSIQFDISATTIPNEPITPIYEFNLYFSQYNDEIVESSTGTIPDNSCFMINSEGQITSYNYDCGVSVKIPESIDGILVKSISDDAFIKEDLSKPLISIDLSQANFLTTFKFSNFSELKKVILPKTLTSIQDNAFENVPLSSIDLPDSLTSIGSYAFLNSNITELTIPESVETVGTSAFVGNNISKLTVGKCNRQTGICNSANYGLSTSVDLTINSGEIVANAFKSCNITKLTLKDGVTYLGTSSFYDNKITELVMPDSVTALGSHAFYRNSLTSVTLSKNISSIGIMTFYSNKLSSITIPSNIVSIEAKAFFSNKLTNLIIEDTSENPSKLTNIGTYAFRTNLLTEVKIPSSVTTIGESAFANNSSLSKIIVKRVSSDGMTLGTDWNGTAQVMYDPS